MLIESQITFKEHITRLLKELFEYFNDYLSFLTEIAYFNPFTKALTNALASFRGQASGSTAVLGHYILKPNNLSIILFINYLLSFTS